MEEDDDDLYGSGPTENVASLPQFTTDAPVIKAEDYEDGEEEGEEIEQDDSDSDIDIITERKPNIKAEQTPQPSRLDAPKTEASSRPTSSLERAPSRSQAIAIKPDPSTSTQRPSTTQPSSALSRPGHSYPSVNVSTLQPNAPIPIFDPLGKPLTSVDFDADLAEHDKPWRRPGADQSDWFNYGFDEFTWATYCLRQKEMRGAIEGQKAEAQRFEQMFGGGMGVMPGMGGGGGGPGGQGQGMGGRDGSQVPQQQNGMQQGMFPGAPAGGMPGMGGDMNPEMMSAMMQQMMASGMDPSQMDFGTFMQQMQMGGGPQGMGMGGAPQGPGQGYGGGDQGYGRGGGRGRGRRW